MASVFVSYCRQDQSVVRRLVDDLETLGHTVWFDEELTGGQAWWSEVLERIRQSHVFVIALGTDTLASTACTREYSYAVDLGKPLMPVTIAAGVSTNLLPPAIARVQIVNYTKQDRSEVLRLARALMALPPAPPLPDPLPAAPEVPMSYLGHLSERIETASSVGYDEQTALLVDLRRSMLNPETKVDARKLLARLRKRRDLFAAVADEIDAMLVTETSAPAALAPEAQHSAGPLASSGFASTTPPPLPAPMIAELSVASPRESGRVGLVIALIVTGPVGWMVMLRRHPRALVRLLLTTIALYIVAGLLMAGGDGIDGYSDDWWEYSGSMVLGVMWLWPFGRAALRTKVFRPERAILVEAAVT
jgi:hypothetical protein